MSWLWSDDLAALLVEHDGVAPSTVAAWFHRPQGHAVPEGASPLELARVLLAAEQDDRGLRRVS